MIVRMKEIWLFTLSHSVEETVQALGELGVVEIREISQPTNGQIERYIEKVMRTESAISILENYTKKNNVNKKRKKYNSVDPVRITDRILISGKFRKQCQNTLDDLNRQLKWYEKWGEKNDLKDFNYLRKN